MRGWCYHLRGERRVDGTDREKIILIISTPRSREWQTKRTSVTSLNNSIGRLAMSMTNSHYIRFDVFLLLCGCTIRWLVARGLSVSHNQGAGILATRQSTDQTVGRVFLAQLQYIPTKNLWASKYLCGSFLIVEISKSHLLERLAKSALHIRARTQARNLKLSIASLSPNWVINRKPIGRINSQTSPPGKCHLSSYWILAPLRPSNSITLNYAVAAIDPQ